MRFLLIILFFIGLVAKAQPPHKFYSTYGGNGYDVGYDVKQTLDGGYIITGSTSSYGQGNTDMYLLKIDSMGQKVFQTTFGGVSNEIGKSVVQLSDSSYVMAGYTSSSGVGGYDVFLVKADKAGNLIWQKTIGGNDWDFASSMNATADGGFIIAGTTYSYGYGNADGYVIKTDANGDTTWTKTFGGLKDDEFKSVIQTSDGNYALTGYTKSYSDSLGDVWAIKLNTSGDTLWRKFYGGNKEDFGNDLIEHSNGNLYIAGATESYGLGKLDAYSIKTNNLGSQLWQQVDGHPGTNEYFSNVVIPLADNSLTAYSETDNLSSFGVHPKIFILNSGSFYYNATGYGGNKEDEIFRIITTKDKGFACVGYTKSFNSNLSDIFFIKTDSTLLNSQNIIGVKENFVVSNEIDIYPNPTQNFLYINTNFTKIQKLQIIDLLGNIRDYDVTMLESDSNKIKIDLREFDNGIYICRINRSSKKIVINR